MTRFTAVFGDKKPVIAMVHLGAMPGTPLHDSAGGVDGILVAASRDLDALQAAGVDAVMFGNENDRPYELKVDVASTATMAYVIGRLRDRISVPFGVNVLWDPMASMALAAATGAAFVREIFTGTYASDMGIWAPDAGAARRQEVRRQTAGELRRACRRTQPAVAVWPHLGDHHRPAGEWTDQDAGVLDEHDVFVGQRAASVTHRDQAAHAAGCATAGEDIFGNGFE